MLYATLLIIIIISCKKKFLEFKPSSVPITTLNRPIILTFEYYLLCYRKCRQSENDY